MNLLETQDELNVAFALNNGDNENNNESRAGEKTVVVNDDTMEPSAV